MGASPELSLEALTNGLEKLLGYPAHGGKSSQSETIFVQFRFSSGPPTSLEVRRNETVGELKARLQVGHVVAGFLFFVTMEGVIVCMHGLRPFAS